MKIIITTREFTPKETKFILEEFEKETWCLKVEVVSNNVFENISPKDLTNTST